MQPIVSKKVALEKLVTEVAPALKQMWTKIAAEVYESCDEEGTNCTNELAMEMVLTHATTKVVNEQLAGNLVYCMQKYTTKEVMKALCKGISLV